LPQGAKTVNIIRTKTEETKLAGRVSAWPVAWREMRESARRRGNHRLRALAGLAGAVMLYWTARRSFGDISATGMQMFIALHQLILALIVGIVPGLTADTLARERREGTLGLLFLTPLTARGVVIGKGAAQGLRALTLWLTVLPVLTVPFLTGGVSWGDAASAAGIEFCAGVICLAGGLAASSLAKARTGALLLAYGLSAGLVMLTILFGSALRFVPVAGRFPLRDLWLDGFALATGNGGQAIFGPNVYYSMMVVSFMRAGGPRIPGFNYGWSPQMGQMSYGWTAHLVTPGLARAWVQSLACAAAFSLLILYVALALGAAAVERSWRDKPPSARAEKMARRFCSPLFQGWFRRRMELALERNPVAWLQQYSWKARVSKWGLCAGLMVAESLLILWPGEANAWWSGMEQMYQMQLALVVVSAAMFTFAGVSGFLNEKRNGALELLLVTPISVNKIIAGRAWGLWKQFLPAGVTLLVGEIAVLSLGATTSVHWALGRGESWYVRDEWLLRLFFCVNAFAALPVFATYAALRLKNLAGAAALTWVGIGLMAATFGLVWSTADAMVGEVPFPTVCGLMAAINGGFIALAFFLLRHSLARRIYAF